MSLYSAISTSSTIHYLAKKTKPQKKLPYQKNNDKPKLPFPKSYPTPLLPQPKTNPTTKLQALETILTKLEASTKNGLKTEDPQIFASLLESCFRLQAFRHGTRLHRLIPQKLLRKNKGITSKLIRLYACNGQLEEAHHLFDETPKSLLASAFAWNALISGYVDRGLHEDALALYFQMVEEGFEPDGHTFPRVLKACAGIGLIQVGEEIHRHVVRCGFEKDGFVKNALVDMYAKCGDIVMARKVFDRIKDKDLVSWNSMLKGYIRHDLLAEAFLLLPSMIQDGCRPDVVTVSSILTSLSPLDTGGGMTDAMREPQADRSTGVPSLMFIRAGSQIHGWILRGGMEWNLSVANSLIVFYSKEGKPEKARWLFENMQERDVVSWNSIIAAHSKLPQALEFFEQMVNSVSDPDIITFVSVLSACAHLGMVKDAQRFFVMMRQVYGITPVMEHYACMVNLYARAGLVEEAYNIVVKQMDCEAGPSVWGALLYGCFLHANVDIAEPAAQALFELEPENEHNFELLMKIYYNAGLFKHAERVRVMMVQRGLEI